MRSNTYQPPWLHSRHIISLSVIVLAALLGIMSNSATAYAQFGDPILIDFEDIAPGTVVETITVDGVTLTVSVDSNGDVDQAVIFDSANPTGDENIDDDLGTPNENCPGGGPGVGDGGAPGTDGANCVALGHVLIIQENPAVGGVFVPDDEASGGTITFDFSEGVVVNYFDLLDFEEDTVVQFSFFDADGAQIGDMITPSGFGDNSYERFRPEDFGAAEGIFRILMVLPISGAIGGVEFVRALPQEPVGTIGDTIFCDENGDGTPDDGEGIPGVTVTLSNAAGPVGLPATTAADGTYLFEQLPFTDYTVTVGDLPATCNIPSVDPDGGDDNTSAVTLTRLVPNDLDQDFGYVAPAVILGSIGDTIFCDANGNNLPDTGEGLPAISVTLSNAAGPVGLPATTAADGTYLFEELPLGDYTVTVGPVPATCNVPSVDPDGGDDSTSEASITELAPDNLDQDFGYVAPAPLGSIGDTIFCDANGNNLPDTGEGLPGIAVTLSNATGPVGLPATTAADGTYLFEELPLGDYTVTVGPVPVTCNVPSVDPDGGDDSTANVSITELAPDNLDQDFGYVAPAVILGSIGDTIFCDANGNDLPNAGEGLPGISVTLSNAAGPVGTPATTAADGTYLFEQLPLGDYTVTVGPVPATCNVPSVDPDGGDDSTSEASITELAPNNLDQDFGYVAPAPLGSIGDTIFCDANGNNLPDAGEGIPGVTVSLSNAAGPVGTPAVTGADGTYLFEQLPLGVYTINVSNVPLSCNVPSVDPDDGDDSTSTVALTSAAPNNLDQDFGYVAPPPNVVGSIGDTIFCDANGNNLPDTGEGISGVSVTLSNVAGPVGQPAITAADGTYLFEQLPLGSYTVSVGAVPATCNVPSVDPNGGNDNTSTVALTPTEPDNLDQDFGYVDPPAPLGSIGDTISAMRMAMVPPMPVKDCQV